MPEISQREAELQLVRARASDTQVRDNNEVTAAVTPVMFTHMITPHPQSRAEN